MVVVKHLNTPTKSTELVMVMKRTIFTYVFAYHVFCDWLKESHKLYLDSHHHRSSALRQVHIRPGTTNLLIVTKKQDVLHRRKCVVDSSFDSHRVVCVFKVKIVCLIRALLQFLERILNVSTYDTLSL